MVVFHISVLDRMLVALLPVLISLSSRLALAKPTDGEGTGIVFPGRVVSNKSIVGH